ncbi:DUF1516 family protein [Periweissella fabalis]|uniref:DUF1516 family protein n=1 Tax=Periweissella fabalis TaxID=1070421 RepID=A0A7X6N606_9LACO|nr:DUF1516 family protein [Periweissella fabalis]MCM0598776.1 DUF1516 family protein [Periweissella fabalis]NKZ24625.1 DUF1516 family protein [Periweissella fabalis]
MFVLIHLISAFILLILAIGIILSQTNKQLGAMMVISRLLYIILLVTGIYLAMYTFGYHPFLTIAKFICALGLIGTIEVLGAHKGQSTVGIRQVLPVGALFIVVIILGFTLH